MGKNAIRFSFVLLACALGAWSGQASASTAGVVQFVAGDVRIALAAGSERPAAKGSPVSVGDTISTAKASVAQIKMGDGAIIVVQPESRLTVAEFTYAGKEDGSERAQFRLQQGGFRSITGAIGHSNKGNYMIETPIAHIGVRGTDHESWYFPSSVSSDGASTQAGLYNRVNVGRTYIQTSTGEVEIGPNQVGYASSALDRPHLLDAMPDFFNRSFQPRSARGGQQAPVAAASTAHGVVSGQQGTSGAISGSSGSLAGFTAPRGKEGVSFGETAVNPAISPNGATLANAGSDAALGVNWGTWQGGLATVNGRATSGSTNFISSTNLTTSAQLAALPPQIVTGTYTYVPGSGAVNGTASPNGTINSLSVGVNLTTQTVTNYSVNATVGTQNWSGSGSGSFTQYMSSSGISIDGKCSGCTPGAGAPTAHGTATGAFVGGQAEGMITSFGMKAANQSMSGTGLLSR
ncbi:MAG TPA: FecR domain-containing protein [Burkholderiales bacterium]|nr:FecR domain-containing protein [Burkholderiales bacterium]